MDVSRPQKHFPRLLHIAIDTTEVRGLADPSGHPFCLFV